MYVHLQKNFCTTLVPIIIVLSYSNEMSKLTGKYYLTYPFFPVKHQTVLDHLVRNQVDCTNPKTLSCGDGYFHIFTK